LGSDDKSKEVANLEDSGVAKRPGPRGRGVPRTSTKSKEIFPKVVGERKESRKEGADFSRGT